MAEESEKTDSQNIQDIEPCRVFYTISTHEYFIKIDNLSLIELVGITCKPFFINYPAPSRIVDSQIM